MNTGQAEAGTGADNGRDTPGRSPVVPAPAVRVIVVSGLSGAGKTIALRALEDGGYFCIDNLPLTLIEQFLQTVSSKGKVRKIAIGVDIREKDFLSDAYRILSSLRSAYQLEVLFFEAESEVMVRRYKETRRPHPIASLRKGMDIVQAIEEERALLSVLRDAADRIIDTSSYTPHQLRSMMTADYGDAGQSKGINISVISFGFKYGVPQTLDLLFDVRFLPNPYFIQELKALKGTDTPVRDFVLAKEETTDFLIRVTSLLDFLLPRYVREGRAYLVIGVGCTGGRHRSPAVVEELCRHILKNHNIEATVIHRDIE